MGIMPAQILHILFGEDALRRGAETAAVSELTTFVETLLSEYGAAFALGCQGPDIFYHSQHSRPVAIQYGTLLHRRGYGTYSVALFERALLKNMDPGSPSPLLSAVGAYALGFSTHAFLDRGTHPYIVSKAGWVSPSRPETARYARCHAFFERILDVLMLERLRGVSAATWDQEACLASTCAAPPEGVPMAIVQALIDAFPERAAIDEVLSLRIENAFRDAASFYRVTDPARTSLNLRQADGYDYLSSATGRSSVALVYPERFSLAIDYLNLAEREWHHPCAECAPDHRSFPELYEEALLSASSFLAAFLSHFWEADWIMEGAATRIGEGGLSIVDREGIPCAPVHADPLPLDEVLEAQYRLRLAWIARHKAERGALLH